MMAQTSNALDLSGIQFDAAEVEILIDELDIPTVLHKDVQRWIAARSMVALSLAAAVPLDEDYYFALQQLGEAPAAGEELDYAREFVKSVARDIVDQFAGLGDMTSELQRRVQDTDALLGLLH